MEVSGARSSWLTMPRNSVCNRSSSFSGVRSCIVTTTDSTATVRRADRRGVDQHPHAAAVGDRQHDLLGAHGRRLAQLPCEARLVEGDLPPIGEPARQRLQQSLPGLARRAHGVDNPSRLLIERHRFRGPGVVDHDAHRRGLDQGLQVGPGPPLVAVRARVGDRRRRLRREQDEDLLVLGRELLLAFLVAQEEVADSLHRLHQYPVGRESERPDVRG